MNIANNFAWYVNTVYRHIAMSDSLHSDGLQKQLSKRLVNE